MKPPVSSDCWVSTNLSTIGNDEAALDDDYADDDDDYDDEDEDEDDVILTQEDDRSQGLLYPVQSEQSLQFTVLRTVQCNQFQCNFGEHHPPTSAMQCNQVQCNLGAHHIWLDPSLSAGNLGQC